MSVECSECEWDARAGHDPACSRSAQSEVKRLNMVLADKERLAHRLAAECVERLKDQEQLRARIEQLQDRNLYLDWRSISPDDACKHCGGAGTYAYGSTATWRGGIGGWMITTDVCDGCWGSGSASRPWPSWRDMP